MKKPKHQHILNLDRLRAEKLTEMGAELRQMRQQQRLSLEEIAAKTMIRVSLLRAIEEGRIEKLPEPIYIQGFLLRYAETLGLDGVAFSRPFPIGSTWRKVNLSGWYLPLPKVRPIHLYLLYIAVIICAVKGLSGVITTTARSPQEGNGAKTAEVEQNDKASAGSQKALAAQPVSNRASNANKPLRVGLTFQDRSWVQIIADGKTEFEGVLPEGTQRTWEAKQQLVVRAGNAGGVLVAVNDGQAKRMGEPGAVEEVVVPAKQ